MTDYVSTRWYRAPELLLGSEDYTTSVDIWAIGCIFAELLTRKPFLPGADTENQLKLICNMIGNPSKDILAHYNCESIRLPDDSGRNEEGETAKFIKRFNKIDPVAKDLLKKMLVFDPNKRVTIEEALKHEFLEDLHFEADEPTTSYVSPFDFDFEKYNLTTKQTKAEIYAEIMLYHSAKAQKAYLKNRKKYPNGMLYLKYGPTKDGEDVDSDPKDRMKELLTT
jgi:mitogen-activated protein kinase 1/3/mitogen-activated protein kinase 6